MFPTRVGMNRLAPPAYPLHVDVPHTRGDEPRSFPRHQQSDQMFPTRVGMNRVVP